MGSASDTGSSATSAGAGALSGAAAGSVFGPWGAAIGAAVGVGAGLLSSRKQAQASEAKAAGENSADQAQADRLDRAAQYGKAAADETDAQLRENLNVQIGNIDAVRAAAGIDPSSPTTAALRDRTEYIGDRARSIQVGNITAKAAQDTADAAYLRQGGAYALRTGAMGASAALWGGVAGAAGTVAKTNWSSFGTGKP